MPPITAFDSNQTRTHNKVQRTPSLPCIFLTNACCLTNKVDELENVLQLNNVDIAVVTESWYNSDTEGLGHIQGFKSFNKNRTNKQCGGIAVFVKNAIPCSVIPIDVPLDLEILWLSTRPVCLPRQASVIIICAIYYPPKSPVEHKEAVIEHIVTQVFALETKYHKPIFVILGDFNTFPTNELTEACNFKQIINFPTRGNSTLDQILTNGEKWYSTPTSLPPLGRSDHSSVLWTPHAHKPTHQPNPTKYIRKYPESRIREFGSWITHHKWTEVFEAVGPDSKCQEFYNIVWNHINHSFPLQKVVTHPQDKPWMTCHIKTLIKARQKAHHEGKTDLKKHLAKKVTREIYLAKSNFHRHKIDQLHQAGPNGWHKHIKHIFGGKNTCINLSSINELNNAPEEVAEIINKHFTTINSKLPPLQPELLPSYLPPRPTPLHISDIQVYQHLAKISISKSPGPNDIPPRLMREFAPELATPLCNIFNSSIQEGVVPSAWKKATTIPIPKIKTPVSLDNLRPISLTPIPSKILERIIATEVWKSLSPKLDPRQYGNIKGSSTVHYLVDFMNFVATNVDKGLEVTAVTIDLSKAFDLIDHTILTKKMLALDLHESWVKWITSFISGRTQSTRALDKISKELPLQCGVPQGTVFGPLLFLIMVNEDNDPHSKSFKYVDDKTLAFTHKPCEIPPIQQALDIATEWTSANNMQINEKKCAVINFKFNKIEQAEIPYKINNEKLDTVSVMNLLGVVISDDLKWLENTKKIVTKCSRSLYIISKLKSFGASRDDLVRVWLSYLRPITEYAAPLWHPSLMVIEKFKIERLQKRALRIILGNEYNRYCDALELLKLPTLAERRQNLTIKFANKLLTSSTHRALLPELRVSSRTLRNDINLKLIEPLCNTNRFYMSTIPYCTRLLNCDIHVK